MWKPLAVTAVASLMLTCSPAQATTITDPTGDFLGTYTGPHDADLDVTLFGVTYDPATATFRLDATLAGAIDTSRPGFYVIGANTGTGTNNFGSIGAPGVLFNQAIVIQKTGITTIGGVAVAGTPTTISGSSFTTFIPLSLLPSTGFSAINYGFNIWPRDCGNGHYRHCRNFRLCAQQLDDQFGPRTRDLVDHDSGLRYCRCRVAVSAALACALDR